LTVAALPFLLNRIKSRRPRMLLQSDGTASAVGIDIRGFNPGNPDARCSAPAKFSVADLVQPWLDKWNLTAVIAPPGGPR